MSKDVSGAVWVFDATTQAEGVGNSGVFTNPIFVKTILLQNDSNAGDFQVLEASGGRDLTGIVNLAANDEYTVWINTYVRGVYIQSLPTSAKVFVVHGAD